MNKGAQSRADQIYQDYLLERSRPRYYRGGPGRKWHMVVSLDWAILVALCGREFRHYGDIWEMVSFDDPGEGTCAACLERRQLFEGYIALEEKVLKNGGNTGPGQAWYVGERSGR